MALTNGRSGSEVRLRERVQSAKSSRSSDVPSSEAASRIIIKGLNRIRERMGAYGAGLFHDDTASDVREGFLNLLRKGNSAEEASKALLSAWSSSIDDTDDGPVFWLALAATQCEYGCLQEEVLHQAMAVIDRDSDLGRWSGKLLEKRRGVLAELRTKLLGPQPKARRPRRVKKAEAVPSQEVASPDGRGKAVAFSLPGAAFMQVYLEREVNSSRGGGSVFVANCAFDEVEMEWMSGPMLRISYPASAVVQQQSSQHFYFGEVIPIVYRMKE